MYDYNPENYLEKDQLNEKELQTLQLLKDGKYEAEPYISSGGFHTIYDEDPGFHPIVVWWEDAGPQQSGTWISVCVRVGDVKFNYDCDYGLGCDNEWTYGDGSYVKEPLREFLEQEIRTNYNSRDSQFDVAMKTVEDAERMLPDGGFYEVDGGLYYYVEPEENLEEQDEEYLLDEEIELLEMKKRAIPLSRKEAAQRFFHGDYEFQDY